jgi:CRISPR-associated protein Csx14
MSNLEPTIWINVNVANPGQFFACCGLLELAYRVYGQAEGWFSDEQFHIACAGDAKTLLAILIMDPPDQVTKVANGINVKPLIAPLQFSFDGGATDHMVLDAWLTIKVQKNTVIAAPNPPWNFWSGQQTSFRIWRDLRAALAVQLPSILSDNLQNLFAHRVPLSGRFGFDPDAAWNALDLGFSPNDQKMDVASSPAIELLSAIGIQRFRVATKVKNQSFVYATWGEPLAPSVAAAAASGIITVPPTKRFQGRVVSRGSYAALGQSVRINEKLYE